MQSALNFDAGFIGIFVDPVNQARQGTSRRLYSLNRLVASEAAEGRWIDVGCGSKLISPHCFQFFSS